jgi:hypothetical protein
MSTITIPLPDEDLDFLRRYTQAQGSSAEEFLARQARNLREHLELPLPPAVASATGILAPGFDQRQHSDLLEKRHL